MAIAVLIALIFSKFFYLASLTSYYTFYLISKFHVPVRSAQIHLFVFLGAVAAGTIIGGPVGDRHRAQAGDLVVDPGRAAVHADAALRESVLDRHADGGDRADSGVGVLRRSWFTRRNWCREESARSPGCSSAWRSALGGIGAAVLGKLADATSIEFVYRVCSFLPAIGLLTAFLPDVKRRHV